MNHPKADPRQTTRTSPKQSGSDHQPKKSFKVLLVDDHPIVHYALKHILQDDCDFDSALTGKEALKKFAENEYDAIITDIHLPDINGYDLTEAIRKQDKNIPIIGITADRELLPDSKWPEIGINAMFSKADNMHNLLNMLKLYYAKAKGLLVVKDL